MKDLIRIRDYKCVVNRDSMITLWERAVSGTPSIIPDHYGIYIITSIERTQVGFDSWELKLDCEKE